MEQTVQKIKPDKKDLPAYAMLAWALYQTAIIQFLARAFGIIARGRGVMLANAAFNGVFWALLIVNVVMFLPERNHLINKGTMLITMFMGVYWIYTRALYPVNFIYADYFDAKRFLFMLLPLMVVAGRIGDPSCFLAWSRWINLGATAICAYVLLASSSGRDEEMVIAYMVCWCTAVSVFCASNHIDRKLNIAAVVADFFLLLLAGTRGPVVAVFLYLISLLFARSMEKPKTAKRVVGWIFAGLVITLLLIYSREIVTFVAKTLQRMGMSSRILSSVTENTFWESEGRETIYEIISRKWKTLPPFGYGLLGDAGVSGGYYAHNIVIEMITDFGWVVSAVFLTILVLLVRSLCGKKEREETLAFGAVTLVGLIFSGSFMTSTGFWVLIGILCKNSAPRKKITVKEEAVKDESPVVMQPDASGGI